MQSYPLDLTTILYLLQGQSGRLQATLGEIPGIGEPCRASLFLTEGKVTWCSIETHRGALAAQGERALRLLARLGTIEWLWQAELEPTVQRRTTPTGKLSPIPRRIEPISPVVLQACGRFHRRVLGLVDGRRTVREIGALLAVPSTELERLRAVLYELQAMGLVIMDE